MQRNTLYQFLQRILRCGNQEKARLSLLQLQEILELQNADAAMLRAVSVAIDTLPDVMECAQKGPSFGEKELSIAVQRHEMRKQREAAMARMGRC